MNDPGQLYSQSSTIRPDIRWTMEGPSWDDDSYLGYSVVSGEFNGDSDSDVAVGMPRGANLTGKVRCVCGSLHYSTYRSFHLDYTSPIPIEDFIKKNINISPIPIS